MIHHIEEVTHLDPAIVNQAVTGLDHETITIALKGVSPETLEFISSLPALQGQVLTHGNPVPIGALMDAHQRIIDTVNEIIQKQG